MKAQEERTPTRTSIYTDEETLNQCRALFMEAGVTSISQFVKKAIDCYTERLMLENHSAFLAKEVSQAIRNELRPITSRLSKGLYRYAVELDMLCQIIAYQDTEWGQEELEIVRRFANTRTAKNRGNLDIKSLLDDQWNGWDTYEKYQEDTE